MPTLSNFLTICTSVYTFTCAFAFAFAFTFACYSTDRILLPGLKPITESCMVIKFSEKET